MKTSFKSITNVQNWRLAAITLGGALAMSLATTAFAAAPNIMSGNASGTVGVAFSYQITANQSPITLWGASNLPPGLTVNTTTGVISGTPTTAGTYNNVILSARNSSNQTGTKTVTFTINNPSPPSLNGNNNATETVGVAFSYQIQATNNPTSYNTSPNPPAPGLTVSTTTGLISGTPTTVGNYSVTLSATNAGGTGTKGVTFKINSGPTSIATISPLAVWAGDQVTLDGSASHTNPPGGTLDYNWQQQAPSVGTLVIALTPPPPNETDTETFIAPAPQPMGTLSWPVTYNLKVTDNTVSGGAKNTVSNSVTTTVYAVPVADAEPKGAHVNEGDTVHLSGSAANPQPGATFSYKWTGPVTLFPSDTAQKSDIHRAPGWTSWSGFDLYLEGD
jgi:putative Ig domain-containing protein